MRKSTFRAGISRVDITPPLTAPHAGWGAQTHIQPDGVDQPLNVTALVIDDGTTTVAWCEFDLVIISSEETAIIQERVGQALGIPAANVRVSVTHNHAGPPPSSWDWIKDGLEALQTWYRQLPEYASGAALAARNSMVEARIGVGLGSSQVAINRREKNPQGRLVTGVNPGGVIDPDVLVVRIDTIDGEPLATVAGYTMHPTTLGPSNRLLSADWPGHFKRVVELLTNSTCLFVQGATGDVGPGYEGFTDDVSVPERLGMLVGFEAARVYHSIDIPARTYHHERTWESGAPLGRWEYDEVEEPAPMVKMLVDYVTLPLVEHESVADAQAKVREAEATLQALRDAGAPAAEVEAATFVTKRLNMRLTRSQLYAGKTETPVEVSLLQIGPVVFAGTQGEPFVEIGLQIKEQSPFPYTWFGGYTSGWAGYIPMPDAYPLLGYEVETSPFTPEAAGVMVEGTVGLLKAMGKGQ
ncbi:MAG: neutral/alkaline non-lysosomal ceramidase N-terminal domain-containing protein [Thermomicrobiales bacterium]|nr:neutral/alkaline non-lysosomal ceramidase N-terminal domain-containing protein [Thermomicrobiales bacterium]